MCEKQTGRLAWHGGSRTSRAWKEHSGCGEWIERARVGVGRSVDSYCSTLPLEEDVAMVVMKKMEWREWDSRDI